MAQRRVGLRREGHRLGRPDVGGKKRRRRPGFSLLFGFVDGVVADVFERLEIFFGLQADLGALLGSEEAQPQPSEDVVGDRLGVRNLRISGPAGRFEAGVAQLADIRGASFSLASQASKPAPQRHTVSAQRGPGRAATAGRR